MLLSPSSCPTPHERFGHFRRELRVGRTRDSRQPSGPTPPGGAAEEVRPFVASLRAISHAVDASDYAAIEAGERLPADPPAFIDVIARRLQLSRQERLALLGELAFAILCEELGEAIASRVLPGLSG